MRELCTIIGVGPGLGRALALRFSQEYDVAMIARSPGKLNEYQMDMPNTYSHPCDVSNFEEFRYRLRKIHEGRMSNVLIYNAATMGKSSIDMRAEDAVDHYKVGVLGALVAVQESPMKEGSILLTGGNFAEEPDPAYVSLSLAKAGLHTLAQMLAKQLPRIHVATVTIGGRIELGTERDPHALARVYWALHKETTSWTREIYK